MSVETLVTFSALTQIPLLYCRDLTTCDLNLQGLTNFLVFAQNFVNVLPLKRQDFVWWACKGSRCGTDCIVTTNDIRQPRIQGTAGKGSQCCMTAFCMSNWVVVLQFAPHTVILQFL